MKAGTGKSRTDRHRIPIFPIEYRIFGEKTKSGKKSGKFGEIGIEIGWGLFLTEFADPVFNPVFPVCFPELVVAHPAPMPQAPLHLTAQGLEATPPTRLALWPPRSAPKSKP